MESAIDVTSLVASPGFLYSLCAKCAIPSGGIVTGVSPAGIKVFSAVCAGLPRIISQLARCPTYTVLVSIYPL